MEYLNHLVNQKTPPDLGGLSAHDACKVLRFRATVLDVKDLPAEWQVKIEKQAPGPVPGLLVQGKQGPEEVIVCQSTWTCYPANRDAFTISEYDWMMVEVNLLWRRSYVSSQGGGKARAKIPFICRYCNSDMVDKANLGWHRQMDMCPNYDTKKNGRLKIYPSRGLDGNKESRAVFKKYNLSIPWQMLGKHLMPKPTGPGRTARVVNDEESADDDTNTEDTRDEVVELSSGSGGEVPVAVEFSPVEVTPTSRRVKVGDGPSVADVLEENNRDRAARTGGGGNTTKRGGTGGVGGADTQKGKRPVKTGAGTGGQHGGVAGGSGIRSRTRGATAAAAVQSGPSGKRARVEGSSGCALNRENEEDGTKAPGPVKEGDQGGGGSSRQKRTGEGDEGGGGTSRSKKGQQGRGGGARACRVEEEAPPLDLQERRRFDCIMWARARARELFPDPDPSMVPKPPGPPPGLYCLVEHSGEIIPLELLTDLHAATKALRAMQDLGNLSRKVAAAWGVLKFTPEITDTLPKAVVEGVDKCRAAFVRKSAEDIEKEIEAFFVHHDDVLSYSVAQRNYTQHRREVEEHRAKHVADQLVKFDEELEIEAEGVAWAWSPLFVELITVPEPSILRRPFHHTKEEFEALLVWTEDEYSRMDMCTEPPHMARALKLFARSEVGGRMPMLCPVGGLTKERLNSRSQQVLFAMEELVRCGKIFFPTLDLEGTAFHDFRRVLDDGGEQGDQVAKFIQWRRRTFVKACRDMVATQQENILHDMWVQKDGVDREAALTAFRHVLLLRENIELGYCFGSVEALGVWPRAGDDLFRAARGLHRESVSACITKIAAWGVDDNLEELDDFRASQVLCTFDVDRCGDDTSPDGDLQGEVGGRGTGCGLGNEVDVQDLPRSGQVPGGSGPAEEQSVSGVLEENDYLTGAVHPVVLFKGPY